jgi:3-oxoacyl-[acyl-carrier protein] reductase
MDLGIAGRWALVCAASKGLGRGCAQALADEGVNLVINARSAQPLEETAEQIRARAGVEVRTVPADICTPAGRAAVLAACPQVDILVNNAGGPPPGDFRNFSREDWLSAVDANMITPIELIKAVIDPMIERRYGRVVNITSSSVKAALPALGLSNGARAGLTGFVAGLARQCAPYGVTINNLLPGAFDTDRLRANFKAQASRGDVSEAEAAAARLATIPAGRFGTAEEFGQVCAFLCGEQASYFTAQNFLIDGGAYPGTY